MNRILKYLNKRPSRNRRPNPKPLPLPREPATMVSPHLDDKRTHASVASCPDCQRLVIALTYGPFLDVVDPAQDVQVRFFLRLDEATAEALLHQQFATTRSERMHRCYLNRLNQLTNPGNPGAQGSR